MLTIRANSVPVPVVRHGGQASRCGNATRDRESSLGFGEYAIAIKEAICEQAFETKMAEVYGVQNNVDVLPGLTVLRCHTDSARIRFRSNDLR